MALTRSPTYDAVVVGGGIGGLLSAATVAKAGRSVLLVERLPFVGGRFTTVAQDDYEITTGALHMVPHGGRGMLAQMLRYLGTPYRGIGRDTTITLFVGGRHFYAGGPLDTLRAMRPFTMRGRVDLLKMMALLFVTSGRPRDRSVAEWLAEQTDDLMVYRLVERFIHFALSVRPDQLRYAELRAVFRSFVRYGRPSIPVGGCRAIVDELSSYIRSRSGEVLLRTEVTEILYDSRSGSVCGVKIRDRRSGVGQAVPARLVVSDVGPKLTTTLLPGAPPIAHGASPAAAGVKLHVVSDKSLIPHKGVMLCLDTQRIAGIVQVSNAVPSVVPSGMHMLDTFQVPMGGDIAHERQLALADLRYVFGDDFERHCRVVRASAFSGGWPVNRVVQGQDRRHQAPLPGLLMVGDAYKPAGNIMVEGVAASVQKLLPALTSAPAG